MKRIFMGILAVVICLWAFSVMALQENPVARLGLGYVYAVTFSPDSRILAIASQFGVYLYDLITLAQIHYFMADGMTSVAFNPDGNLSRIMTKQSSSGIWQTMGKRATDMEY